MYWMSNDGFVTTGKPLAAETEAGQHGGWREVIPVVVSSREWAVVMAMRGELVRNKDDSGCPCSPSCIVQMPPIGYPDDGWYLQPSPPPNKKLGTLWEAAQGTKRGERWYHAAYGHLALGHHVNLGDEGIKVTGGEPVPLEGWVQTEVSPPPLRRGEAVYYWSVATPQFGRHMGWYQERRGSVHLVSEDEAGKWCQEVSRVERIEGGEG